MDKNWQTLADAYPTAHTKFEPLNDFFKTPASYHFKW